MQNPKIISATEFKKHFLQLVDEVATKRISFIITKRKIPTALVSPLNSEMETKKTYFGFMKGTTKIKDDIVNCSFESDWEDDNE